jgi:hypothetical protein
MRLGCVLVRIALGWLAFLGGTAWAQEATVVLDEVRDLVPRNYGNLRIGASSSSRHPALCLELSPLEMLSIDACGTGSGFLHHDPAPEIAHFRAWVKLASWKTPLGWLQPRVGAGFAELQVGEDTSGFHFSGVGPTGVETAGPEVGASLRLLFPVVTGVELVGEVGLGAMYFHYAPRLLQPQSALQPAGSVSVGVGF